jgi:tRNA-splicing ligase RtcB (3'-phosphate/5'-hydroxy nucleic acid ligase)
VEVYEASSARTFGLKKGDVLVSLHCGSRGLGHQVATDYAKSMLAAAAKHGISLADRELACAPIGSAEGKAYWGAMNAAGNCALANRQILTHLAREVFRKVAGIDSMPLLRDVSHNMCRRETHEVDGKRTTLYVHRKGATRAFAGQPVLVGGSMGTSSYILAGLGGKAFASACHGAGRRMSRNEAVRKFDGHDVVRGLAHRGILIKSRSPRGVAEEAPQAYKDVDAVASAAESAGLAKRVCRLEPLACVKG